MYPEVAGTVKQILVGEGQLVKKGQPLLLIDESIQRATAAQQAAQAQAAHAMLEELKAEPRKETLDVTSAQVKAAESSLKLAKDTLDKTQAAYAVDPGTVSKDSLDSALNTAAIAKQNLEVAEKQYALTKAGAWIYDINNQQKQYLALERHTLHQVHCSVNICCTQLGMVSFFPSIRSWVPMCLHKAHTTPTPKALIPSWSWGDSGAHLNVRCYVDEILVSKIPPPTQIKAQMTIRGTDIHVPLTFDRIQPLISPKIELSDQRQERVDVRVLPVVFRLQRPTNVNIYPGELVDVYIGR